MPADKGYKQLFYMKNKPGLRNAVPINCIKTVHWKLLAPTRLGLLCANLS